jgi:hypothetical protein
MTNEHDDEMAAGFGAALEITEGIVDGMQCPFPIYGDDGTAVMCIKNGHCGCDNQEKS